MKQVNDLINVLRALGYDPKHNEEAGDIYFVSHGSDAFPESYKNIVRALLGNRLSEFYYGGIDTQHIYYHREDKKDMPILRKLNATKILSGGALPMKNNI